MLPSSFCAHTNEARISSVFGPRSKKQPTHFGAYWRVGGGLARASERRRADGRWRAEWTAACEGRASGRVVRKKKATAIQSHKQFSGVSSLRTALQRNTV
jgi:hypothetical protein